ncbi:MAG TPA: hypothetical protein VGQ59_10705 [Cyclobacteriaceae bacterium]|jgi:predicted GH43/DUF377 family glycosyl hydrolase|nr:hypothetical protein [Cyclobacteriaceae bacterium]
MKWLKRGLIYSPSKKIPWMRKYGMAPTPFYLEQLGIIRLFMGVSTIDNYGSTSYVDVKADDPSQVLFIEDKNPVLGLGRPGTFDDCGAVPSCCIEIDGRQFLFFIGFQRCVKVPYMLFPGLAISDDGKKFERFSESPIIDRDRHNFFSYAAPCVIFHEGIYKMWLWIGNDWLTINKKLFLNASIGYAESKDGIDWKIIHKDCIVANNQNEFSIGRPWVIHTDGIFKMYYSVRYIKEGYRLGYAESMDGINWQRKDEEIGITVSESGWDSEMICYPSVLNVKGRTYLFYCGNNNGETGFGWAELVG